MEKEQINIDEEQVMTYFRQGVAGETSVLPSIEEVAEANDLTLADRKHDLVDFLKRPIDVVNTDLIWTTSQRANDELIPNGIPLPDVFLQNPMVREKLQGFLGLKGTIKARIMINAQKFQQGVLMPYWIPNYDNITTKAKMVRASLSGKSGCAHVLINCEAGTEQTISIPYVNQNIFYNMATGQGNYGRLFLTPLLQLTSKSGDSVGVRIQMWMENPEPTFATSAKPYINLSPVQSQSVSQIEEKKMHSSNTGSLNKGGGLDVARIWQTVKDSDLKPSYLSRSAANALEVMGFQKPTQTASIDRINIRPASYMANFNGEFMGHKIALASNNELLAMKAPAGTDEDEMAITTLVKTPTYYKTFTVKCLSNAAPNKEKSVVFSDMVHPMKFVPVNVAGVYNSTFLGYTASAFGQWRGGIKYNFVVAKTGFHSGTLRASFLPGVFDDVPSVLPTNDAQWQVERCYQQTFDLRDKTEFSFVVPYAATKPYLNCINPFDHAASQIAYANRALGRLVIDVFIPVVAPDTVADSFEVAVWVSGDTDMTFANPVAPSIYPYSPTAATVQSQSMSMNEGVDRVAGITSENENMNKSKSKTSFNASAYCTGEVVASVKALCGRFGPFYFPGSIANTTSVVLGPYDFANPLPDVVSSVTFDYLDYFSYLYAFYRGGVRIIMDTGQYNPTYDGVWKIGMRSTLNSFYPLTGIIPRGKTISTALLPSQYLKGPSSMSLARTSLEGFVEFEVPYYNLTHITPALTADQTLANVQEANYPLPLVTIVPRFSAGSANTINYNPEFYRACADDFRFMYMVGPPQVALLPSAVDAVPVQYANIRYGMSTVTRSGNNFAGLFGVSSFVVPTANYPFTPPNQFIAYDKTASRIYMLPSNLIYKFTAEGDYLRVNTDNYTFPNILSMWSNPPTVTFTDSTSVTLLTSVFTVNPATGKTQSAPKPCISVGLQTCTQNTGRTSISIPGLGVINYGEPFTTTTYVVVTRVDDSNAFGSVRFIDIGVTLILERENIGGTTYDIRVLDSRSNFLGYFGTGFTNDVGFEEGIPTFCPTEATPIVI